MTGNSPTKIPIRKAESTSLGFGRFVSSVITGKRHGKRFYGPSREVLIKQPGSVVVNACGHRYDPRTEPRSTNCQSCWNVYFQMNVGVTQATAALAEAFGQIAVRQQKGKKFYRAFVAFIESRMLEAAVKYESQAELIPEVAE
jgi:hypothetical protein